MRFFNRSVTQVLIALSAFFLLQGQAHSLRFVKSYSRRAFFARSGYIKDIKVFGNEVYFASANGVRVYNFKRDRWRTIHRGNSLLPSNYISKIAVDEFRKTVWFATPNGVARYTPNETSPVKQWKVFTKRDGLADNEATSIAIDSDYVWVGTRYWGISRYDKKLQRWRKRPYTPIDGLGSNKINDLVIDGNQIWAGTDDGLSVYDPYTDLWSNFDAKQGLSAKQVTCIDSDGKGIWAGTYGGGLNYFDKETYKFKVYRTRDGLVDDVVFSVKSDGTYVWAATFSGVSRFRKDSDQNSWTTINRANYSLVDNNTTAIAVNGNRIWFGSDGEGATLIDKKTPQAKITGSSGYTKPGFAAIYATVRDSSPIVSYKVSYRASIYSTRRPSSAGITLVNKGKLIGKRRVANLKIAEWRVRNLSETLTYDVILEVVNSKGQRNKVVFPFVVDNNKPVLNLDELPESVKTREIFIRGRYFERYLHNIYVSINNSPFKKVDNVNRKTRRFKHKLTLRSGNNRVLVRIVDVGRHQAQLAKKIIYDPDKPQVIAQDKLNVNTAEVVLKGRIKERFLSSVYVMPGKKRALWKKNGDQFTFEAKVALKRGENKFEVVAVDRAGSRGIKKIIVNYNTAAPSISFNKDLPQKSYSPFFTVKGVWDDKDLREIIVTPGDAPATVNRDKKTFQARVKLKDGFNTIKVTAIDEQDNKTVAILNVVYEKSSEKGSIEQQLKDASVNYKLYLQYRKKYESLLKKYKALLLQLDGLRVFYTKGKDGKTKPRGIRVPPGNSLFFVPYKRRAGDTMENIAKRYLGNSNAKGIIARFNNDTPASILKKRGSLLVPTNRLIRHLFSVSQRAYSWMLIDIVGESFNTVGPGRSFYAYKRNILNWLLRRGLVSSTESRDRTSTYLVGNRFLLSLHGGGSLGYRINLMRQKMKKTKVRAGYIVFFRGSFIQFYRVQL